ncbi:hypothetical protein [uncultured Sphingomonas sp.]|uniref:hypothetical protein n=1 Tax=uncultured Sphingomonas sp. TaxID=158754 RepID=UPI0025E57B87|nr:hypothetical protein [uncultured Sphingomonas sp.]
MATTAAAVMAKARRDVMSHFLSRDAVSPEKAVPYQPDRRVRRRMFEQFQRAGVLKPGTTGWYVDVPLWDDYSRRRRRRAGALIGGSIAIGAALALIFA